MRIREFDFAIVVGYLAGVVLPPLRLSRPATLPDCFWAEFYTPCGFVESCSSWQRKVAEAR